MQGHGFGVVSGITDYSQDVLCQAEEGASGPTISIAMCFKEMVTIRIGTSTLPRPLRLRQLAFGASHTVMLYMGLDTGPVKPLAYAGQGFLVCLVAGQWKVIGQI